MKAVYLAQGRADLLDKLDWPEGAAVYALCYDRDVAFPWAAKSVFDPRCTWAEGRNRLADIATRDHPDFDYLIFADDDVEFVSGSFADFERAVADSMPALAVPLTDKVIELGYSDATRSVENAIVVDEQLVAIRRDLVGVDGICPLVTRYDHISWHTGCLIFEYLVLFRHTVLQFNTIRVLNRVHRGRTGGSLYHLGDWRAALRAFRSYLKTQRVGFDPQILPHIKFPRTYFERKRDRIGKILRLGF